MIYQECFGCYPTCGMSASCEHAYACQWQQEWRDKYIQARQRAYPSVDPELEKNMKDIENKYGKLSLFALLLAIIANNSEQNDIENIRKQAQACCCDQVIEHTPCVAEALEIDKIWKDDKKMKKLTDTSMTESPLTSFASNQPSPTSMTEILKVKGDWQEVVNDCRSTVGKESLGHEPTSKFKRSILLAEHSPIRDLSVKWRWKDIPHWVGVHWVRHKWECFVRTQRSDRTGVDRTKLPQDTPQTFVGEANSQHLIDTMRKRLCRQASPETREYAEDLKVAIQKVEPELSDVLVPNCIYRCGCPEMSCCGFYQNLIKEYPGCMSTDIQKRYDTYNKIFWSNRKKKEDEKDVNESADR